MELMEVSSVLDFASVSAMSQRVLLAEKQSTSRDLRLVSMDPPNIICGLFYHSVRAGVVCHSQ